MNFLAGPKVLVVSLIASATNYHTFLSVLYIIHNGDNNGRERCEIMAEKECIHQAIRIGESSRFVADHVQRGIENSTSIREICKADSASMFDRP